MNGLRLHDPVTAPEASKPVLEAALRREGRVANLYGVMAEAPVALRAYDNMTALFMGSSLSPVELDIVWLTTARLHGCGHCVREDAAVAGFRHKTDVCVVTALKEGRPLADPKLEALRRFVEDVIQTRGQVSQPVRAAFIDAGYGQQQMLEVILGITQKTLATYTHALLDVPVDDCRT